MVLVKIINSPEIKRLIRWIPGGPNQGGVGEIGDPYGGVGVKKSFLVFLIHVFSI